MRNHIQSSLGSIKNTSSQIYPEDKPNNFPHNLCNTASNIQSKKDYLLSILLDLDGVTQDPYYHPEVDTLYHSLQVFQIAFQDTDDPVMLAAALFHDIGKSIQIHEHALIGANMLHGLLIDPIPWLIEHHLDLPIQTKRTRKRLSNTTQLKQLELLRRWDLHGRQTNIEVISPQQAIEILTRTDEIFQLNQ